MKLLNTSFLIYLLVIAINGNAQRTCPRVDEFYRGRHKIDGMSYLPIWAKNNAVVFYSFKI